MIRHWLGVGAAVAALLATGTAAAQTSPAMQRSGYSLPWGLRPAIAPDLVRLDTSVALRDTGVSTGYVLTAGGRPIPARRDLGFYVRAALVHDAPSGAGAEVAMSNPLVMAMWTPAIRPWLRMAVFAGVTIPVGMGGGNDPDRGARAAMATGIWNRSALDNALFVTNYCTPTAGVGFAYIRDGLTLQAEATVLVLARVRGERVDTDETRVNFTTGFHVGYRVIPHLTVSAEARYQHWLSTPSAVAVNSTLRGQFTAGLGVRGNLPVTPNILLRPGLAYFHPIGGNMDVHDHRVLVVDVATVF